MEIKIINVSKKFKHNQLFNNISLTIPSGKITCIYGPSGCGKTTLIDMIGLIEPYDGTITYNGKEIKSNKDKRMMLQNNIGFIFQDFGLIEDETVKQNFEMVKNIKKIKDRNQIIEDILNKFNLHNMLDRKVYELSGGEQQRIAIARNMLKDPDLILADEPTAALDVDNKKIVMDMLKDLASKGKTIIIVSHDLEIIEFADYKIDLESVKK